MPNRQSYTPEYQELKFTLHRKLLDKINLEALATIDNQRVAVDDRAALVRRDRPHARGGRHHESTLHRPRRALRPPASSALSGGAHPR